MKYCYILVLSFILFSIPLFSQIECGHSLYLKQAEADSLFKATHDALEKSAVEHFTFRKKNTMPGVESGGAAGTIPVVVHILHDDGAENIAEAQVQQALAWLNAAFAHVAPYAQGSGVNTGIHFCLATRDPEGRATSGIVRVKTPLTVLSLAQEEAAKASSYWPSDQYLNIWVVRDICWESLGCGVAAYASVPSFHGRKNDGIVIEHTFFGTTPGRTAALIHEAGHYLGLYHTFEGGCTNNNCLINGDRVCDTPPDQSTAWLPCDQTVNTCTTDAQSGFTTDMPDARSNFLDYGNLDCMHDFTAGQTTRMNFFLNGIRKSLLTSRGCQPPCPAAATAAFLPGDTVIASGSTVFFQNLSTNGGGSTWTLNGQTIGTGTNLTYFFNSIGIFTLQLNVQGSSTLCDGDSITHLIQVICPATANFSIQPQQPKNNEPVTITNLSQNATTFTWFVNNAQQSPGFTGFTPTQTGSYIVRLVARNGVCTREKTLSFTVISECDQTVFQKIIDVPGADSLVGMATAEFPDGNMVVGANIFSSGSILVVKTDKNGSLLWSRQLKGNGPTTLEDLIVLEDGGLILTGNSVENGLSNAFWARVSSTGAILWQRSPGNNTESRLSGLVRTQGDRHFVAAGWISRDAGNRRDIFILKFTADGSTLWSRRYSADRSVELTSNSDVKLRNRP